MKNGWVKHFTDGTKEEGWDDLINTGLASWSKGRLDNIVNVELWHEGEFIAIFGLGEYWQSDTFETQMFCNDGKIVERTLYRKITEEDSRLCFHHSSEGSLIIQIANPSQIHTMCDHHIQIKPEWIGHWLSLKLQMGIGKIWEIKDLEI